MCTVAAWLFTGLEWLPWHRDPRQWPTVDTMPIDAHPRSSRLVWFAVLKRSKLKLKLKNGQKNRKSRGCVIRAEQVASGLELTEVVEE